MGDGESFELNDKITQLLINTLCSDKEIFLLELIRNASDAVDKRFAKVIKKSKLGAQFIRLVPDKANKTLSIIDSGIGMTRHDLVQNLAFNRSYRIVHGALWRRDDISQMGVGIFSAFLVADKIIVTTKYDRHDQYILEFHDSVSFTVSMDLNGERLPRGTKITLFLKEDQLEYLEETRIKDLVKKHCEFISHPIYLWTEKTKDEKIGNDEPKNEGFVKDVVDDEENNSKNTRIKDVSHEWQLINVWWFKPKETTKEECGLQLHAEIEKKFVGTTSEKLRSHIPDDIAFSILSKLPLKSLKRFGCVNKSWALLFENPCFMNIFYNNFISNLHFYYDDTYLLLCHDVLDVTELRRRRRSSLFSLSGERFQDRIKLDWPNTSQEDDPYFQILASVNGIICLHQETGRIVVLWNPTSMEFKVIPPSPSECIPPTQDPLLKLRAFGYDHLRDDYKVLRYVCYFEKPVEMDWAYEACDRESEPLWEIYSLRSSSWKQINVDIVGMPDMFNVGDQIYLEGMCYWLTCAANLEPVIISFDFINDTFTMTFLHLDIYDDFDIRSVQKNLVLLNGSLALISNYNDNFYISILADFNVKESWTKLFVVGPVPCVVHSVIGAWKKGHIFFKQKDGELACFDLSTREIQELGVNENYQIIIHKERPFSFY